MIRLTKQVVILILTITFISCETAVVSQEHQKGQKATYHEINQSDFAKKTDDLSVVVIDVRTPQEVARGYIDGADVFMDVNSPAFEQMLETLDKSLTYYVYCASGVRSAKASGIMVKKGFTTVYNLDGGISAWSGNIVIPQ